ncbi:MAG: hypothetical protein ACRER8_04375 [Pseudomonas sp.]|uniref:hypothetical protein n=1 Tax=Pseudomonas sp. TaxID=306 RepID=UPI003D6DC604
MFWKYEDGPDDAAGFDQPASKQTVYKTQRPARSEKGSFMLGRNNKRLVGLLAGCCVLTGCAKDRSFSPPAMNEYVNITVKVPSKMKVTPMKVMYRSNVCKRASHDGNFNRTEVDGYYSLTVQAKHNEDTDFSEAQLARQGGGQCDWRLSNVTFAVVYENPTLFGDGVTTVGGGGGGAVVIFDNHNSPQGGADFVRQGDLLIKKHYYPWVREHFLGGYGKDVRLYGGGGLYLMYRSQSAKKVHFEPLVHQGLVTYSEGPKVKKKGNNPVFTYPDGQVIADGRTEPDLRILEAIRVKAASIH